MSLERKEKNRKMRRTRRVRNKLKLGSVLPRVTIFRSNKNIYAQVVDAGKTVVSLSNVKLKDFKGDKKDASKSVGVELAKKCIEKGINAVQFDRGPYLYHGRVRSLAEGLREGGLKV